jgi:carbon monoxide dehydrogenase subunit G
MKLTGQRTLPVDRATAWAALNDVDLLKAAIPGCSAFEVAAPGVFNVGVLAAVGPVKTGFNGTLTLADAQPPESSTLRFDMKGGAAGFARGEAKVRLEAIDARRTEMHYDVDASVGGRLAQVGSRLVDAAAATMADRFFEGFVAELAARQPAAARATGAPQVAGPGSPPGRLALLWRFLKRLLGAR